MKQITGGITAAKGFQAAGIEAGIKYQNRKDMAIIYSEKPCVAAGTFTSNVVKAAPVKWDRKLLEESPYVQAVIVNTGIANAGTGAEGMKLCEETAKEASRVLGIPENAHVVHHDVLHGVAEIETVFLAVTTGNDVVDGLGDELAGVRS